MAVDWATVQVELTWDEVHAVYNALVEVSHERALDETERKVLDDFEAVWEDRP